MEKQTIRVNFTDFWPDFVVEDNFIMDVLRMYYNVKISDQPDYLFYSCFGSEYLNYDCIRIFYTGENLCPDFNLCDYGIGFEYLTLQDRYFRYPLFYISQYKDEYDLMLQKNRNPEEKLLEKKGFCSMVVSAGVKTDAAGGCDPIREKIFEKLCEYKTVASGGRYLNNIGMPQGVPDKLEFQKKYKFALCFENCSYPGYCTEKIVQAFAAGTVPIYWGDPMIEETFNEKAFVNCNGCDSLDEVVSRIKEIDENNELYLAMLREPALKESDQYHEMKLELGRWLQHIIDQPIEKAYRRSRISYQAGYEDERKRMIVALEKVKKQGRLVRKIKEIIKKWNRVQSDHEKVDS